MRLPSQYSIRTGTHGGGRGGQRHLGRRQAGRAGAELEGAGLLRRADDDLGQAVEGGAAPGGGGRLVVEAQLDALVEAGGGAPVGEGDGDGVGAALEEVLHVVDRRRARVTGGPDALAVDEDVAAAVDLAEPELDGVGRQIGGDDVERGAKDPALPKTERAAGAAG